MEFRSYSQDINKRGPEYLIAFLHPILKETILETDKIPMGKAEYFSELWCILLYLYST
jgi:hypothetical protein